MKKKSVKGFIIVFHYFVQIPLLHQLTIIDLNKDHETATLLKLPQATDDVAGGMSSFITFFFFGSINI